MKYFLLKDDLYFPERWFLGPLVLAEPFDFWKYTGLGPLTNNSTGLEIKISSGRLVLDFTFSDFAIPIINDKVASFLPSEEIQLINVKAGVFDNLNLLMILHELDCVDESSSDFTKFDVNHPVRPDLAGNYEVFYKLVLDTSKCGRFSIFKIKGYHNYIIVNEIIKNNLIQSNAKGLLFQEV